MSSVDSGVFRRQDAASLEALVDADLDTLVTALYVKIDDMLVKDRRPGHPVRLSQPELVCLAVAQALPGFHSEHRWIRFAICHLRGAFPYRPHQPGYNRPVMHGIGRGSCALACDRGCWLRGWGPAAALLAGVAGCRLGW